MVKIISKILPFGTRKTDESQALKTYSGLYEGGKATYTYYENENEERVKHGKFTFDRKVGEIAAGNGIRGSYAQTTYHVSGNYNSNIKNGEWKFKYKAEGGGIVHEHFSVVINYSDGDLDGTLKDVSTGDQFQMKNNRIIGQVRKVKKSGSENVDISGQFDYDGFPDGAWTKTYQSCGNLYVDTEKYVHGLLVSKQTKNESTGRILKREFGIDPLQFLDAQSSGMEPVVIGKQICQEKIHFRQGEGHRSDIDSLPEIFGAMVTDIIERVKKEKGIAAGQSTYMGIPFKEILAIGEAGNSDKASI